MPKLKCPTGITRIDRNGFGGFSARISRQGKHYTKAFGDVTYGGKRAALEAAKVWYAEMEATLPARGKPGPKKKKVARKKAAARKRRAA